MSRFWSDLVHDLQPYVPGEQPRIADLVKLNTNEAPFGPSPRAMAAIAAEAAETLRLYPDPQATALRETLAAYHGVAPDQVFVGNGSDEVLAHAFAALLRHDAPLLFPDITYSFYPVYCRLFGITHETVPLDESMRIRLADYRRPARAGLLGPTPPPPPPGPAGVPPPGGAPWPEGSGGSDHWA
jgi:histidinol-phosphate aminotransferase